MWQEIAIILVAVGLAAWIAYKIYTAFTRPKSGNSCAGCSGCAQKRKI
ncbi:hypothetical protein Barb6_00672 [Bacteroidales bacterium Barb6]|nr:hypothetical protein Barb6_00672 [Bacteroidales bacterium Barb6]